MERLRAQENLDKYLENFSKRQVRVLMSHFKKYDNICDDEDIPIPASSDKTYSLISQAINALLNKKEPAENSVSAVKKLMKQLLEAQSLLEEQGDTTDITDTSDDDEAEDSEQEDKEEESGREEQNKVEKSKQKASTSADANAADCTEPASNGKKRRRKSSGSTLSDEASFTAKDFRRLVSDSLLVDDQDEAKMEEEILSRKEGEHEQRMKYFQSKISYMEKKNEFVEFEKQCALLKAKMEIQLLVDDFKKRDLEVPDDVKQRMALLFDK